MSRDLVVGIDSSTTATKAIAWTGDGTPVAEGRGPIPMANPAPDHYEQDPEDWWRSTCQALRSVAVQVHPGHIAGLAISNQRETFVPLDRRGQPVRPAIIWLDRRCAGEVDRFAAQVGPERIHEITGKPVDVAPVAYRIAWMKRHEPRPFAQASTFADVHSYLAWRLTGSFRTSWASADPLGLFDMRQRAWSPEVLEALGLSADRLPEPRAPGSILGEVSPRAAAETGLAAGTPVIAGGGDGQAAGLGVGALSPDRAYLNLGTAVVAGIYSPDYHTGRAWRTMGSCSGVGYYYETSLRTGTFLVDWFVRNICETDPAADPAIYRRLEVAASEVPPGSRGLLLVPYWGAVMTPYWDPNARGAIIGFTATHDRAHAYRAALEGVAFEQALVTRMIEDATGIAVKENIAIGGGAASDLWCRILADTSGKTIKRSATVEASCLGAAICAAAGAGWFSSVEAAAAAMTGAITSEFEPDTGTHAVYADLLKVYREIYPALRQTFIRLAALAPA